MFLKKEKLNELETNGFLIINLFDEREIDFIQKLYYLQNFKKEDHFQGLTYSLIGNNDRVNNVEISTRIKNLITEKLKKHMTDFEVFSSSFINKFSSDSPQEFYLHQDWSYTDESKYPYCYTIWTPLQEVSIINGTLFVLKKSHQFVLNHRSYFYQTDRFSFFENNKLYKTIEPLNLKKGEAVLFKQALFHGSYPNVSALDRLVCVSIVKHIDTPLYYYVPKNSNTAIVYEIEKEDFEKNLKIIAEGGILPNWKVKNEEPYFHDSVKINDLLNG